jgi:hypothetical protein
MESYDVAQSGARPWCISASARNYASAMELEQWLSGQSASTL